VLHQLLLVVLLFAPCTAPVASSKEIIALPSFGMKKATDVMKYWTNLMKSVAAFLAFYTILGTVYVTLIAIIRLSFNNFP